MKLKRLFIFLLMAASVQQVHAGPNNMLRFSPYKMPKLMMKARAFPVFFQSILGYSANLGAEVMLKRGAPHTSFTTLGVSAGFTQILYSDCCGHPDSASDSPVAENKILSVAAEVRRYGGFSRKMDVFAGAVLRIAAYDDIWKQNDRTIHRTDVCPALVGGMRIRLGKNPLSPRWMMEWYAGPQVKFRTADRNDYHDILSNELLPVKPVIFSVRFGFNFILGLWRHEISID